MTENFVLQFGYLGLFVVSFLAATLFPFSSEAMVVLMPALGYKVWLVFTFATAGNFLGALTNYYVGKWGGDYLLSHTLQVEPEKLQRAYTLYRRWGAPLLLLGTAHRRPSNRCEWGTQT